MIAMKFKKLKIFLLLLLVLGLSFPGVAQVNSKGLDTTRVYPSPKEASPTIVNNVYVPDNPLYGSLLIDSVFMEKLNRVAFILEVILDKTISFQEYTVLNKEESKQEDYSKVKKLQNKYIVWPICSLITLCIIFIYREMYIRLLMGSLLVVTLSFTLYYWYILF